MVHANSHALRVLTAPLASPTAGAPARDSSRAPAAELTAPCGAAAFRPDPPEAPCVDLRCLGLKNRPRVWEELAVLPPDTPKEARPDRNRARDSRERERERTTRKQHTAGSRAHVARQLRHLRPLFIRVWASFCGSAERAIEAKTSVLQQAVLKVK